jgi:hypothetical protein
MRQGYHRLTCTIIALLISMGLAGCTHGPMAEGPKSSLEEPKVFELKIISPDKAKAVLMELDLGKIEIAPDRNAVTVTGPAEVLHKAQVVLDLIDSNEAAVRKDGGQCPP